MTKPKGKRDRKADAEAFIAAQLAGESVADGEWIASTPKIARFIEDRDLADASNDPHARRARTLAAYLRLYASEIEDATTSAARKKVLFAIIDRVEERAYDRASTALVMFEHVIDAIKREALRRLQRGEELRVNLTKAPQPQSWEEIHAQALIDHHRAHLAKIKTRRRSRGITESEAAIKALAASYPKAGDIKPKDFEAAVVAFAVREGSRRGPLPKDELGRSVALKKTEAIKPIAEAIGIKNADMKALLGEIDRAEKRRSTHGS